MSRRQVLRNVLGAWGAVCVALAFGVTLVSRMNSSPWLDLGFAADVVFGLLAGLAAFLAVAVPATLIAAFAPKEGAGTVAVVLVGIVLAILIAVWAMNG